jgi:hypothetical protein
MRLYIVKYALTGNRTGQRKIKARNESEAAWKCHGLVKHRPGFLYVSIIQEVEGASS